MTVYCSGGQTFGNDLLKYTSPMRINFHKKMFSLLINYNYTYRVCGLKINSNMIDFEIVLSRLFGRPWFIDLCYNHEEFLRFEAI